MADLQTYFMKGKVTQINNPVSGVLKDGKTWKFLEFVIVINPDEKYPKEYCFKISGDHCEEHGLILGDMVEVEFQIICKPYNGKYYNELKCKEIFDV